VTIASPSFAKCLVKPAPSLTAKKNAGKRRERKMLLPGNRQGGLGAGNKKESASPAIDSSFLSPTPHHARILLQLVSHASHTM
jgi:hypothetical protein